MQVSFRTIDGKEHVLELDPGLRLSEVKEKLAELLNWSASEVKLLLSSEDDVTLESLELAPSSFIGVCKRSLNTRKVAPPPPPPPPPAPPEPEAEQDEEPATTVSPRPEEPSVQPLPNLTGPERPELGQILADPAFLLSLLDPEGRVAVREAAILEEERSLTENERNLVSQLVEMCGMDRRTVLQVFNACGHDGNTTANVLLSMKSEKDK